ncbi:hypothetical protein, partial [Escherichia coli]|uniref:hypothetical protein n=1 Tax=Escherichia coli TaxID=562 RepID=UPI00138684EB
ARNINFQSIDGEVNYWVARPWNYGDVRGFEISLSKNRGRWVQGFVNYTYMARKTGNFGFTNNFENPESAGSDSGLWWSAGTAVGEPDFRSCL